MLITWFCKDIIYTFIVTVNLRNIQLYCSFSNKTQSEANILLKKTSLDNL